MSCRVVVDRADKQSVLDAKLHVHLVIDRVAKLHAGAWTIAREVPLVTLREVRVQGLIARFEVKQRDQLACLDIQSVAHRDVEFDVRLADGVEAPRERTIVQGCIRAPEQINAVAVSQSSPLGFTGFWSCSDTAFNVNEF